MSWAIQERKLLAASRLRAGRMAPKTYRHVPARPDDSMLRKQYYFRASERGLLAWDVDHLIARSSRLPRRRVPLSAR